MSEDKEEQTGLKALLFMLEKMIDDVERLPLHAMTSPITHYDYHALMVLVLAILKKMQSPAANN